MSHEKEKEKQPISKKKVPKTLKEKVDIKWGGRGIDAKNFFQRKKLRKYPQTILGYLWLFGKFANVVDMLWGELWMHKGCIR